MADIATLSIAVDSRDISRADGEMQKMGKTGEWLEGLIGKLVAAWAAWEVASKVKDIALLASRYETLGVVMGVVGNNAGYTRDQMEAFAQTLQKSGISMTESRNTLTVMAQAHIDLAKSQDLAREAQDAAVIGNINSSEAFQRMIYGIQSGQTDVLRTIGINVNFEQSYKKLADQLGKSANSLTELEKVQARTNAVMDKAPDIAGAYEASMGTAGKQVLSMKRYIEDLEVKAGAVFGPALKVMVDSLTDALKGSSEWFEKNAESAKQAATSFKLAAEQAKGLIGDIAGIGSGSKDLLGGVTLLEIGAEGLALVVGGLRDMVNTLVGLTQVSYGLISIIGRGVDEFAIRLTGIRPPAWIEKLLSVSGTSAVSAGWENLKSPWGQNGGVSQAYAGDNDGGAEQIKREVEAQKNAAEEENKRIKAGAEARKKAAEEEKRLASHGSSDALRKQKTEMLRREVDAYNKNAIAAERAADAGIKDNLALQDFVASLQPARVEAEKMAQVAYDLGWALADEIINQREYNDLMGVAKTKFTDAGRASEEYKKSLQQDANYLNNPTGEEEKRLNDMLKGGLIGIEIYNREMQKIRVEQLRLKAESGNTWAIIGDTIGQNAGTATDAMVSWMNATDGLARTWDSLGDTFRNVISDMLIQMQKAIIQQQLMKPLMSGISAGIGTMGDGGGWSSFATAFTGAWGGGKASGGSVYPGTTYLVGENGPELLHMGSAGSITPNGSLGQSINAPITVIIQTDGTATTKGGESAQNMKALGNLVASKCREVIAIESRPNGLLAR